MTPRIVLAALSIALDIAVISATVTTVMQLNLQAWSHSASLPIRTNHSS
jgi:hypothetical protein